MYFFGFFSVHCYDRVVAHNSENPSILCGRNEGVTKKFYNYDAHGVHCLWFCHILYDSVGVFVANSHNGSVVLEVEAAPHRGPVSAGDAVPRCVDSQTSHRHRPQPLLQPGDILYARLPNLRNMFLCGDRARPRCGSGEHSAEQISSHRRSPFHRWAARRGESENQQLAAGVLGCQISAHINK